MKLKENHLRYFNFSTVEEEDVDSEIASFDASKAILQNDVPVKIKQTMIFFVTL